MKFFGKGRKFCPKIKFYLLASYDCFNTLQIWLKNNIHTSSLRGGQMETAKKKKKKKKTQCKFNILLSSFLC